MLVFIGIVLLSAAYAAVYTVYCARRKRLGGVLGGALMTLLTASAAALLWIKM